MHRRWSRPVHRGPPTAGGSGASRIARLLGTGVSVGIVRFRKTADEYRRGLLCVMK